MRFASPAVYVHGAKFVAQPAHHRTLPDATLTWNLVGTAPVSVSRMEHVLNGHVQHQLAVECKR